MVLLSMPIFLYLNKIIVSLLLLLFYTKMLLVYPAGDYDNTNYDCECKIGQFLFSYVNIFLTTMFIF